MKRWRLWSPRTLFGKLALLMLVTLICSQLIAFWVLGESRQQWVARQAAEQILDVLADAETQLDGLKVEARDRFLDAYNHPGGINLLPADGVTPPVEKPRSAELLAIVEVLAKAGLKIPDARVEVEPVRELWLSVRIVGNKYWLILPLGRLHAQPPYGWVVLGALFASMILLAASWFAWRIGVPLRQLTRAAARMEKGETPERLPESGPEEVRVLASQFNRTAQALAQLDEDRRVMLAGVSHDLRTPLTRMRLSVEMMEDAWLREGMLSDLQDIEQVLKQFSDYARGEPAEEMEPVDLRNFVYDVVEPYRRDGKPVDLLASANVIASIKPVAMRRLLGNLIDNALRYGKPPVLVTAVEVSGHPVLKVIDQGAGFSAVEAERLLRPFTRGEQARTADGGSGLGLSIVQRIAEDHAAQLSFRQTPEGFLAEVAFPPAGKGQGSFA